MIPFECALIYKPLKGKRAVTFISVTITITNTHTITTTTTTTLKGKRAVTFFTRCITDEGLVKGMPIGKEITTVDSML